MKIALHLFAIYMAFSGCIDLFAVTFGVDPELSVFERYTLRSVGLMSIAQGMQLYLTARKPGGDK